MDARRVGIIGAGQLGRMMALAGYPLGIECTFVDTQEDAPGGRIAPIHVGAIDDASALEKLARGVEVVTFDIENVSVDALEALTAVVPVAPNPAIVAKAQDRLAEKRLFEQLGIPTAPYCAIADRSDLEHAGETLGWPIVLKARRLGYDGRGQRIVNGMGELLGAWDELGSVPAIAEAWIEFECEVSLIGVRGRDGQLAFYPLSENRHRDGMLEFSIAPYESETLTRQAQAWMATMLEQHDYVGVLTIEFFVGDNGLIANEIAPRVHNSGHWTIEGAETSQFENHLRAILGLPIGTTGARGTSLMRNLIGSMPSRERLLAIPGLHLHDYCKSPRPRRKLGHCTLLARDRADALDRIDEVETVIRENPI